MRQCRSPAPSGGDDRASFTKRTRCAWCHSPPGYLTLTHRWGTSRAPHRMLLSGGGEPQAEVPPHLNSTQVYLDIVETVNLLMSSKGAFSKASERSQQRSFRARRRGSKPPQCLVAPTAADCAIVGLHPAGAVLKSDVNGKILLKCLLTVRPPLRPVCPF